MIMKIALIAGIILFMVLASIAASVISGLVALVIIGCVRVVKCLCFLPIKTDKAYKEHF